jgi:hypothetical protein
MTMSGLRGSLPEDQNVWADSHTFRGRNHGGGRRLRAIRIEPPAFYERS